MSIPDNAAVSQLYTWKREKDDLKHPKGLAWKEHKPKEGLGPFVLKNGSHRTERYISSYRVPKCDVIENEICEIMGFVKIF